jgi:hypothetical protein
VSGLLPGWQKDLGTSKGTMNISAWKEKILTFAQGPACTCCNKYRKSIYTDGRYQCPLCDLKIVEK